MMRSPSSSPLAWIVPLTTNPVVPSTIRAAIAGILARATNSSFAFNKWRRNWWNMPLPSRDINARAKARVKERVRGGTEVRAARYKLLLGRYPLLDVPLRREVLIGIVRSRELHDLDLIDVRELQ